MLYEFFNTAYLANGNPNNPKIRTDAQKKYGLLFKINHVFNTTLFYTKYGLNFSDVLAKALHTPMLSSPAFTAVVILLGPTAYGLGYVNNDFCNSVLTPFLTQIDIRLNYTVMAINSIATVLLLAASNIPAAVILGATYAFLYYLNTNKELYHNLANMISKLV